MLSFGATVAEVTQFYGPMPEVALHTARLEHSQVFYGEKTLTADLGKNNFYALVELTEWTEI